MSELGYWVEHSTRWKRKPIVITRVNKIHSSYINYTELEMNPSNNYKTESYLNGEWSLETWKSRKITFNPKKANIVEIFRFKVSELDLNSYDTVKYDHDQ